MENNNSYDSDLGNATDVPSYLLGDMVALSGPPVQDYSAGPPHAGVVMHARSPQHSIEVPSASNLASGPLPFAQEPEQPEVPREETNVLQSSHPQQPVGQPQTDGDELDAIWAKITAAAEEVGTPTGNAGSHDLNGPQHIAADPAPRGIKRELSPEFVTPAAKRTRQGDGRLFVHPSIEIPGQQAVTQYSHAHEVPQPLAAAATEQLRPEDASADVSTGSRSVQTHPALKNFINAGCHYDSLEAAERDGEGNGSAWVVLPDSTRPETKEQYHAYVRQIVSAMVDMSSYIDSEMKAKEAQKFLTAADSSVGPAEKRRVERAAWIWVKAIQDYAREGPRRQSKIKSVRDQERKGEGSFKQHVKDAAEALRLRKTFVVKSFKNANAAYPLVREIVDDISGMSYKVKVEKKSNTIRAVTSAKNKKKANALDTLLSNPALKDAVEKAMEEADQDQPDLGKSKQAGASKTKRSTPATKIMKQSQKHSPRSAFSVSNDRTHAPTLQTPLTVREPMPAVSQGATMMPYQESFGQLDPQLVAGSGAGHINPYGTGAVRQFGQPSTSETFNTGLQSVQSTMYRGYPWPGQQYQQPNAHFASGMHGTSYLPASTPVIYTDAATIATPVHDNMFPPLDDALPNNPPPSRGYRAPLQPRDPNVRQRVQEEENRWKGM